MGNKSSAACERAENSLNGLKNELYYGSIQNGKFQPKPGQPNVRAFNNPLECASRGPHQGSFKLVHVRNDEYLPVWCESKVPEVVEADKRFQKRKTRFFN